MPPKAAGKAKKSKKSAKPKWMADDVWAVSQDFPALLNSFAGIKSDKPSKTDKGGKSDRPATPGKAGKAAKAEALPNIPKAQVIFTVKTVGPCPSICLPLSKVTRVAVPFLKLCSYSGQKLHVCICRLACFSGSSCFPKKLLHKGKSC